MKDFAKIQIKAPKRNTFNLSHDVKLSCKFGQLIPVLCEEVLPGDNFKINTEALIRFAPLVAPTMHEFNVYFHNFFVPNRLVWDSWKDFITGGENGTTNPAFPNFEINKPLADYFSKGKLGDYLGIQTMSTASMGDSNVVKINSLPFRAYALIYNEFYRDQNLETPIPFSKGSGSANTDIYQLTQVRKRAWEKDYFTTALPWAQRGAEVELPLVGDAPITSNSEAIQLRATDGSAISGNLSVGVGSSGDYQINASTKPLRFGSDTGLQVDMSQVSSATINELRRATALQKWFEKSARGGSRYIEQILSHFGVKSSDSRLQRPEYLGGSKLPVVISEVLQTSNSTTTPAVSPQGNMAGHAIAGGGTQGVSRQFEEHGFIFTIMSIMPRTSYFQGIPRKFSKIDRFDYYWPDFAHLGEQEVKKQELFFKPENANDNQGTFGYQARYSEYKYSPSRVSGDFRDSYEMWHAARKFSDLPALNADFVKCDGTDRIFAVQTATIDKLYCHVANNVYANRPIPQFSIPTL